MGTWIDVTAEANWTATNAFHDGTNSPTPPSPPWFFEPNQGQYYGSSNSTTADGLYYEFLGGVWTPTLTVGSPPTSGMIPCLTYAGPTFSDLDDVRITVRNRSAISGLGTSNLTYYGPFDDGSAIAPGSYSSGTEFILSFGDLGRSNEFDDISGGDIYQLLNRIYSIVATSDSDFLHYADSPRVLFDIVKIEFSATPIADFWQDFLGCQETL